MSISFSGIERKEDSMHTLRVPPFVVATKSAHMLFLHAGLFEELPLSPLCKVSSPHSAISKEIIQQKTPNMIVRFKKKQGMGVESRERQW